MKTFGKRAQEEMVGFVLIVIIVAIVAVIFLGFSIKKPGIVERNSTRVQALTESLMLYTSECEIAGQYKNTRELIKACYSTETCSDGKKVCDVLKEEIENLMKQAMASEADMRAYKFVANAGENETERELINIENGNMTGTIYGYSLILPAYPEKIKLKLEVS